MDRNKKEFKLWEIWIEGYMATGEHGTAQKIGEYWANSFDEAVEQYIKDNPDVEKNCGPRLYTEKNFSTLEHFQNRRSNWNIWACALFDTEKEARKFCG